MELRDFVTESLVQIQEGVQEAIHRIMRSPSQNAGKINPLWTDRTGSSSWRDYVQKVEFDVAVTVTDKQGREGKAGIKVFEVAELGGGSSKSTEQSSVSRIKFTIPIVPAAQPSDPMI